MVISRKAYAKINLFLEVCDKRSDGYHNIDSIMQTVSLCDNINIERLESSHEIIIETDVDYLCGDNNIVYKAIKSYFDKYRITDGFRVLIEKNIPIAAGLGGGSADAAEVLLTLNEIYKNASESELYEIGKQLGADVPFCMKKGTCLVKGIGEDLYSIPSIPSCYIVIACGEARQSTKEAYQEIDNLKREDYRSSISVADAINKNDLLQLSKKLFNRFESVVAPDLRIKQTLENNNSLCTLMSGSGPSVFGLFEDYQSANKAKEELSNLGLFVDVVEPVCVN